jgi:hypothetical protein
LRRVGECSIGGCLEEIFLKGTRNLDSILTLLETREMVANAIVVQDGRRSASPLKFIETFCDPEEAITHSTRIQRLRNFGIEISLLPAQESYFHL